MKVPAHASVFCVIAGGGTAGHVLPGVAIAQALVDRGHGPDTIRFVGSERGVERKLVPAAGFPLEVLPGRGIARKLTFANVGAVVGLMRSVVRSIRLVRRWRPAVVVSLGGYASVGATVAAVVWRVPLVVTEQNATAGLANRVASRFARACAVPFADVGLRREVVTGNPVRRDVARLADGDARNSTRGEVRAELGIADDRPLVVVFSGSLGARKVNEAVVGMVQQWSSRPAFVYHVTGERDHDLVRGMVRSDSGAGDGADDNDVNHWVVGYEQHMERMLAAADVVVCRSGGTSVAEVCAVGVPAVLVPLPGAPRDHQRANAAPLVESGGAMLVDDTMCTASELDRVVGALVDNPERRAAMAAALRTIARPDAADTVAALIEEHAHGS